ncbi:heavy metal translocating P-type ATPase [Lutibaculum baratangense]|uniref:Type cbb3 cytochrome oxidase biogenesis protein CcoI n=1 Tax=Lutibaculum baratangense AMV1 TaxID=631454 RepID=V4R3E7_9HYPH|nr:heavy metal translocating P-type ATPase [Lutibaculum baratangense]ESR26442.1 Type cbb3 cytochrome oxidase biogenesis protein CcoI [Lutibaculum baratangense AMV1]
MGKHQRDLDNFVTPLPGGLAHLDLAVEGVRCAGCMAKIEKGLGEVPGIERARLNFSSKRLAVDWRAGEVAPGDILDRLEALGFSAYPFDPGARREAEAEESRRLLKAVAVSGFAAANIMLLSVSVWSGNATDIEPETRDLFHWVSALIAIPTVGYAGQTFFRSAAAALKAGRVNMDVPISIGVILALSLSLFETFTGGRHAYFDAATMLLFFLLIGRWLDVDMRRRTRAQAENLAALKGESALQLLPDGEMRRVPLSALAAGDRVLVAAGDRISVDGTVESGRSEFDRSLVTGETAYEEVAEGGQVHAGTLNIGGALVVRVTAASEGTLLDEVNGLLEKAEAARSSRLALADRAAKLYAPMVHSTAALTFLGWMLAGAGWQEALTTAIAVLIITCPCALALAVPAVQVVASGLMFRAGVLLNDGSAIERLADVTTVVFDKTGTLTLPSPALVEGQDIPGEIIQRAARLARSSRHPLAEALQPLYQGEPFAGAREHRGQGVEATLADVTMRLGSATFCGVPQPEVEHVADGGHSIVWYREGDGPAWPIRIGQTLRPDAVETIEALKDRGLRVVVLSGDRHAAVSAVADELEIDTYFAGLTPTEKVGLLDDMKRSGQHVLMVGDGLNDAPALAAAHVSMSPVSAVHLSQAAADAIFLGDRLVPVLRALRISGIARRAMSQNLAFSALYNVFAIPVAVAGFVTPLLAAVAMSLSSITVTLNALRLRYAARKV